MKKNYGILLAVCFVILYVAIRSYTVDITHDEAYSFHNVKHFWYAESLCTANTHWLNSVAIKVALLFKLESNWAIRWFSTLSAIVFFIVCFLFIRALSSVYHKMLACAVLLFNPFVLDYFGLARGYASGLMFEGLALLFFMIGQQKQKRVFAFTALLCAGLSAIANYSFVYFFAAFSLVHFYIYYLKQGLALFKNKNIYLDVAYCLAISAFIVRAWMFILKCSNDLGAGTNNVSDVCAGFAEGLFYQRLSLGNAFANTMSFILIPFIVVVCLYGILTAKKHGNSIFFYSSIMLGIILSVLTLNFVCFHIVLPYARSSLFLFPLVSICVIYFLEAIFSSAANKIILTVLSIILLLGFIRTINFSKTLDFDAQEDTRRVFNYVDSIGADNVGMSWETYGVYRNYYQMTDKLKYHFKGESIQYADSVSGYNYLLLSPPYNLTKFNLTHLTLTTVKTFAKNNIRLVKVEKE